MSGCVEVSQFVKAGCHQMDEFLCGSLAEVQLLARAFGGVTRLENTAALKANEPFRLGLIAESGVGKTCFSDHMLFSGMGAEATKLIKDRFNQFCHDVEAFGKVFRYDLFAGVFGGTTTRHCQDYNDPQVRLKIVEHANMDWEPFDAVVHMPERGLIRIFSSACVAASQGYVAFMRDASACIYRPR